LHRTTVSPFDLLSQIFAECGQLRSIGCADVSGNFSVSSAVAVDRSEPKQLWKLAGCQPRHSAAVVKPAEREASVTIKAVPAKIRGLKSFASHGLYRIAEERLNVSDFCAQRAFHSFDHQLTVKLVPSSERNDGTARSAPLPLTITAACVFFPKELIGPEVDESVAELAPIAVKSGPK
jgi:hypothetical protein